VFPELPGRNAAGILPEPYATDSDLDLQCNPPDALRQPSVPGIYPGQTLPDHQLIEENIFNPHESYGPAVPIRRHPVDLHQLSEDELGGKVVGFLAEGLALLRAVDAIEADPLTS
jgi:hypothetical protein